MFKGWPDVKRLLLVHLDPGGAPAIQALQPAIAQLRAVLPALHLVLWTREADAAPAQELTGLDAFLFSSPGWPAEMEELAARLRQESFDAALILSDPGASPFAPAYACYLAGIPVRLGQSLEFGGSVLSHRAIPAYPPLPATQHHLHLLGASGLARVSAAAPLDAAANASPRNEGANP